MYMTTACSAVRRFENVGGLLDEPLTRVDARHLTRLDGADEPRFLFGIAFPGAVPTPSTV